MLAAALVCTAVRETFEECGVLITSGSEGPTRPDDRWNLDRVDLTRRTIGMAEVLARRGVALDASLVVEFARWITPHWAEIRYDTRFYGAWLPDGQRADADNSEAEHGAWFRVDDAVAQSEAGYLPLMLPTYETLWRLARALRSGAPLATSVVPSTQFTVRKEAGRVAVLLTRGDTQYVAHEFTRSTTRDHGNGQPASNP
ncbi:MAG: NUDIX hydrolase, partial [Pseudonocardiaceae bacterium]|nr:NUDIX hydrolase [Pseudonocardiaceae bacterium]